MAVSWAVAHRGFRCGTAALVRCGGAVAVGRGCVRG